MLAEKFLHRVRDVNSFLCTMSPNMQAKVVVTVRREVLDCVNMLSLLFGKVTSRKEKRWRN